MVYKLGILYGTEDTINVKLSKITKIYILLYYLLYSIKISYILIRISYIIH